MNGILDRLLELHAQIAHANRVNRDSSSQDLQECATLKNQVQHALKLEELVKEEWIRVQDLAKKPMDSFACGQYKIIRHLVEASQGIKADYIDTKSLREESQK